MPLEINQIATVNDTLAALSRQVNELINLRREKVEEIAASNAATLQGITEAQRQALAAIDAQLAQAKQDLIDNGAMNYFTYFEASKPLLSTNPAAVGSTWYDTTTGICYTCTDNTSGANIWRGSDGSQISPNTPPTAPTSLVLSATTVGSGADFTLTPSGSTDADGTVTHYEIVSINPEMVTARAMKIATGESFALTAKSTNTDLNVTISVRAIDNDGAVSEQASVVVTLTPVMAGEIGGLGAGVGVNNTAAASCGLSSMIGCDNPAHANFGNYIDENSSVFVCIPRIWYKIDNNVIIPELSPRRKVEISYTEKEGFIPHPAFKNSDGSYVDCVFVSKYQLSNSKGVDAAGGIAVSKKLGDPICSATYNATYQYNSFSRLTGRVGVTPIDQNKGAFDAVRTMGEGYCLHSELLWGVYQLIADAHIQAALAKYGSLAAIPASICAWADKEPYDPKGNNNNALADHADTALTFTKAAYSNKALAGSGSVFAKTAHNGQACGIVDLCGNMWEINAGHLNIGGTHYVIKGLDKLKELTTANYEETSRYDVVDMSDRASTSNYLGNATASIYSATAAKAVQDALRAVDAGRSASGTIAYGQDYQCALPAGYAPLRGGYWYDGSNAGVRTCHCSGWTNANTNYGVRALLVPSA